ncbi:MAG: hypothetical protein SGI89_10095, partial [bacterium]|nr:hypothetical protein [bacterium]
MDDSTKIKILKERITSSQDLLDLVMNILHNSGIESHKEYSDGNDKHLIYKQKSFEEDNYYVFCILKLGDVGGITRFEEKNRTQYILNEINSVELNGFSFNGRKLVTANKIIIITNGLITENFKNEIDKIHENVIYWDVNILCSKLNEKWPDYFNDKEPVIHEYMSNLSKHLENVSKELQILYYNKTTKTIWETFIDLQLEETKVKNNTKPFKHPENVVKSEKLQIQSTQIIDFKKLIKNRFKTKDIFDQKINCLIFGDMGSGKSTIFKKMILDLIKEYIARDDVNENCRIPILVLAKSFKFNFSLYNTIEMEMKFLSNNRILNLNKLLLEGEIIIFIDGLDEISEEQVSDYLEEINRFTSTYEKTQVIISSRPSVTINKSEIFSEYRRFEILPLDFQQIEELLEKWYPTAFELKEKLLNVLRKTFLSSAIPKTPLAITLLAIIFDENEKIEEIPANITELYNKFTEIFLGKWDKENGMSSQDKFGIRTHLINHIALTLHFKNLLEITENDLFEILTVYKNSKRYDEIEIEQLECDLMKRNPLLIKTDNSYKFIHKSFQEYFASKGIEQTNQFIKNHENFLVENFLNEWWSNVILFYVGNKNDCPLFIK